MHQLRPHSNEQEIPFSRSSSPSTLAAQNCNRSEATTKTKWSQENLARRNCAMATSRREKISSSSFARSFSAICASPFSASKKQDLFSHPQQFKSLHLDKTWNFAPRLLKMTEKKKWGIRKRPTSMGTRQMGKIRDITVYKNFFVTKIWIKRNKKIFR